MRYLHTSLPSALRLPPIRRGFTLVELLVVIAIIGILVSLLLPAVQAAREAARRMQCQNHLHNLALAIHNYENQQRELPPATDAVERNDQVDLRSGTGLSWIVRILPYMEEQNLFDQFDLNLHARAQPDTDPQRAQPSLLLCPSDEARGRLFSTRTLGNRLFAKGNYAAFVSPEHVDCMAVAKGALIHQPQSMSKIEDGTSNTLMLTEVRTRDDEEDQRGVWAVAWVGSSLLGADVHGTNVSTRICRQSPIPSYVPNGVWAEFALPPNAGVSPSIPRDDLFKCPDPAGADLEGMPCWTRGDSTAAARSLHMGGVNACNVDGSVTWIADDIDIVTYGSRISINDGLVINDQ